ncbi:MAG: carboxypeptidase-like regulatory domain-containing protein [Candidatus Omnitrophota bacterium]
MSGKYPSTIFLYAAVIFISMGTVVYAESEPNDDIANANYIELNSTVDGDLASDSPSDAIDCYTFTLESDGFLQVGVVPTAELNVEFILKDSDGVLDIGRSNSKDKGGVEGVVYPNLRAGVYYAVVKIPDNASGVMKGTYSISVNFAPVEEIDVELNDIPAQAVMPVNGETKGHIGYYGSKYTDNKDFYDITLPNDGQLELTLYPDGTCNLALGLYDSAIFNNIGWVDQKGKGESEKIVYPNLLAGTYRVLVNRSEGYGSYNLTSLYTESPYPSGNEPNETVYETAEIALEENADAPGTMDGSMQGRLGYYGNQYRDDNDYFRVVTSAYGKLSFGFTMEEGNNLQAGFQVWDEYLRYLSARDGSLTLENRPAGTYYVRMYRNNGYGAYTMTCNFVSQEEPAPFTEPTVDLPINGEVNDVIISAQTTSQWFTVYVPEDGNLIVKQQFAASAYVYLRLYSENAASKMAETYSYWTADERSIQIPNIRMGTYLVNVSRADGSSLGTVSTIFTPVTKLDEEPNDSYTSLGTKEYNQSYVGHIGFYGNGWQDNLDLYEIYIPEDGSLTVTAKGEPTLYFYLRVYSAEGNAYGKIGETYGYWNADPHAIGKPNILAGKYLVEISRADGYGSYDLDIQFTPNRNLDAETNGNDWTQPQYIDLGAGYVGHLGFDRNFFLDSSDYYVVELPEDGSFWATFQTDATGYFYWRMYYADFETKVSETYSYWTTERRSIGSDQLRAGKYYIAVDRADGYGTYQFYTTYTKQEFADEEANILQSQAQLMYVDQQVQGALGYTDRYYRDTVDWYKVDVTVKGDYKLSFQTVNWAYFHVGLWSPNQVANYSSDYRYWTSDLFTRNLTLDVGTYYIACWRADGFGPYNLRLGDVNGAPAGSLSGIVSTANKFPLGEVSVKILNRETKTDILGNYSFADLPPGYHTATFSSGAKYYPETRDVFIEAGKALTLDITMLDANKTAPLDVEKFYGVASNEYIHFFWSPSASPDVADGGGYKLYINDNPALDLKNVLDYRSFGFLNDVQYTCRLTVYDKYGNESAGYTIILTPGGQVIVPTPTPTLPPGERTPTPTATMKPGQTPYPVQTPYPTYTPYPTFTPQPTCPIVIEPTPGPVESIKPDMIYEFDMKTLQEDGWMEQPGGFIPGTSAGFILPLAFADGLIPSSADGKGLAVTVRPKDVAMLFALAPVETGGYPVLMRMNVTADMPNAAVWLIGLKGALVSGQDVDGSIAYVNPQSSAGFTGLEKRLTMIYEPGTSSFITPMIQVAGLGDDHATVYIDRVEIYILKPDMAYPGYLFGNNPE